VIVRLGMIQWPKKLSYHFGGRNFGHVDPEYGSTDSVEPGRIETMCVDLRRFLALLIFSIPLAGGVLFAEEEGAKALASVETKPTSVSGNDTEKVEKKTEPIDDYDYPGRGMESEWRKEAAERIDEYRKAELTVLVTDARGKPIREADVSIRLKQHAFRFGTVVSVEFSPAIVAAPPPDDAREKAGKVDDRGNGVPDAARTPRAEMPAGHQFSNEDRAKYREKLFALFNTASPKGESLEADQPMTAWLRSRGFLFDAEPVQEKVVPATFTIANLKPPEELLSDLKKLNEEMDLPLVVRRFSLAVDLDNLDQLQLQADYTRDFFTVLFSIPGTREISIDGFWAPVSEVDGWALFAEDWSIRPVGRMYADLVKRVWITNEEGLTDGAGKVKFRGFIGLYRISVVVGSRMKTISAVLPKGGAQIKIQID
jgi:hypothetical protein